MAPPSNPSRRGSKSASPADGDGKGNVPDDISLASTFSSQYDPDEEFNVENILDENYDAEDPGDRYYLIQWTGYELYRSSWEPEGHLDKSCLDEWEETKKRQERGEEMPFDTERWEEVCHSIAEKKVERHKQRNRRRKREGLALNLYEGETAADYDLSDEDVNSNDFNSIFPPPRKFDGTESQDSQLGLETAGHSSSASHGSVSGQGNIPDGKTKTKTKTKLNTDNRTSSPDKKRNSSSEKPKSQSGGPDVSRTATMTGYQGTARRPSTSTSNALTSKFTSKASKQPSKAAPSTGQRSKDSASRQMKAKKTKQKDAVAQVRSSSGNVFTGGKMVQARPKLADIMADKSRKPNHFLNYRMARKAELRGREKADRAPPDPSKLGLFNISTGVASTSGPASADTISPGTVRSPGEAIRPAGEPPKSALRKTQNGSPDESSEAQEGHTRKKSRSVRFTGDERTADGPGLATIHYNEDTPMVDEPGPIGQNNDELFVPGRPPTPPRGSSQREAPPLQRFGSKSSQNIGKTVVFGPAGSRELNVTFEEIPTDSAPWISAFTSATPLVFGHVCTAKAFASQCNHLKEATLAFGNIASLAQSNALENTAEQLRLGSFGLAHFHQDYCIVLYPTRCEDWKTSIPEADPSSQPGVSLKHMIFKAHAGATKSLAIPDGLDVIKSTEAVRVAVMRTMFGFNYEQLLPTQLRQKGGRHNFFLAFPRSKGTAFNTLWTWLRDVNPECRIFTSRAVGDWLAFVGLMKSRCGTVIIHDAALQTIRLFPEILKLLHGQNGQYSFWSLQESLQDGLVATPSPALPASPPLVRFTRLFPSGSAVLVTPSFLITRPRQARQLLECYSHQFHYHQGMQLNRLVLSANIADFLGDVAREKATERKTLLAKQWSTPVADVDKQAQSRGLSEDDCRTRFKIHSIVMELMFGKGIPAYEGQEPFVFVDGCINANDEQSLVNWFGWWSQIHLGQYRKFHVLGSHEDDTQRAVRQVLIPRFTAGTTGDPGAAQANQETRRLAQASQESQHPAPSELQVDTQSDLRNLKAETFREHLEQLIYKKCPAFLKLYKFPVSWFGGEAVKMACHFGDFCMEFESFKSWFSFLFPFADGTKKTNKKKSPINTYVGLFYTIAREWDPTGFPEDQAPPRHPWIAVYRVHQPFRKPFTHTELIIWDPAAADRVPEPWDPRKSQLMPAQRALIDLVEEKGLEKNPNLGLYQVWYGGYAQSTSALPAIDRTLEMLSNMVTDTYSNLPARDDLLPEKGFKKVLLNDGGALPAAMMMSGTGRGAADKMDIDPPESSVDDAQKENIVFHAPRGTGPSRGAGGSKNGSSNCRNEFFHSAVNARAKKNAPKTMIYKYTPTLQWYMRQKGEGRHFEHINVDSWEPIFKALGIQMEHRSAGPSPVTGSQARKDRTSAGGGNGQTASTAAMC